MEGIYFLNIEGTCFVKIGRSRNVEKRIKSLQQGFPFTLIPLLTIECNGNSEKKVHNFYSPYHKRSEWFEIPMEYINNIEKLKNEIRHLLLYDHSVIFDKNTLIPELTAYEILCEWLKNTLDTFDLRHIHPLAHIHINERRYACNRLVREGILRREAKYCYRKVP